MMAKNSGWLRMAIVAAALSAAAPAVAAPKIVVGQTAPDTEMTLLDGSKVNLSSLRGQVVVLNFWATWCVPCRVELPLLDGYYRRAEKYGLRVFAITTEGSVPAYRMKPLFAALAITPAKRVKGEYANVRAVPTNYIIDRAGIVRYAAAAAFDLDDLNRLLVPLLKEAPPAGTTGG
jgi:thiol-disulfide isomerase/thioredoxin